MSILSDLFRGKRNSSSAQVAKDRLLTVLVHDRVKLTPDMLEQLKQELSAVIERYVPAADASAIEVSLLRGDAGNPTDRLKADVPLRRTAD